MGIAFPHGGMRQSAPPTHRPRLLTLTFQTLIVYMLAIFRTYDGIPPHIFLIDYGVDISKISRGQPNDVADELTPNPIDQTRKMPDGVTIRIESSPTGRD
jgi:hypothetical protein